MVVSCISFFGLLKRMKDKVIKEKKSTFKLEIHTSQK